jgi:ribosomal protein S18 acetylase RimI-like enzyme
MIREVRKDEIPECVQVIRRSHQTVADEFGFTEKNAPRYVAFATDENRLIWHMDQEHRLMFLDEESGIIRGYYSLLLKQNGECELGNLSVLPEYRHHGLGTGLLRHAIGIAREHQCKMMRLSIVEENTVLRQWYEQNGAVHTGTEKYDFFPFTCGYMMIQL